MIKEGVTAVHGTLRRTWRLAERPVAPTAAVLGLGALAAVFEGLALLLFIPLIQSLSGGSWSGGGLERRFADLLAPVSPGQRVVLSVALLWLLVVAKNAAAFGGMSVSRRTEGQVAHRLRCRMFEQVLSSCIDYRPGHRRSEIVTTLAENSWQVSKALGLGFRLVIAVGTILVFSALLALVSIRLLLFAALFLAIGGLIVRMTTRSAAAVGEEVVRENKAFGLHIWESIQMLQLIRTFGRERDEEARFADLSNRVRGRLLRLDLLWGLPGPLTEAGILVLIGGLILVAQRTGVGVASLAAFLTLLYRLQAPARELMEARVALDGAAAAVRDVDDLLAETSTPFLRDGELEAGPVKHGIELRNVDFGYAPIGALALRDLSFTIPGGKTTAIVGRSGAGKSTLLALLHRFHDPSGGEIRIDGVRLDQLRLATWRGRLSLMSQDVQLFNDTILANIAYARPGASDDQIKAAARVAHADEFIEAMPEGYQTIVGDRGIRLSGGQRQRIALARTILRDPDVLLLDEPTNALDPESERAFQEALAVFSQGRTVVVIAHRLSTVLRADQVVVIEHGAIVEVGPPAALVRANGRFEQMYELQQQGASVLG
ncbi:ABC transporter ATP-binding protein/permease [Sphingomonas sp. BN140010]|uniref:ABC transporter ATP-binding protein/permease n=1 Tax=Sphingomonas arvum TaxID=2992113 RepID=A0ABT3JEY4_9SPHN|nr:ABC transporter ATP-binding protein [Sphingomonas sp. BN140010]MCW3797366.1 ABC transporter ATP-binding protein/permease [Sphingomonas sp. BN140010]